MDQLTHLALLIILIAVCTLKYLIYANIIHVGTHSNQTINPNRFGHKVVNLSLLNTVHTTVQLATHDHSKTCPNDTHFRS